MKRVKKNPVLNLRMFFKEVIMTIERRLTWQKYEDIIEQQVNSPILDLFNNLSSMNDIDDMDDEFDDMYGEFSDNEEEHRIITRKTVNIPKDIGSEISMVSNFDCWMGYTNFNIGPKTKSQLDSVRGVEVMKLVTRYRFFVGIGKMFKFKDVMVRIHDMLEITKEEEIIGTTD